LTGLIIIGKEAKAINRKQQEGLGCQHNVVKSGDTHIEIYASTKHFNLLIEGQTLINFLRITTKAGLEAESQQTRIVILIPIIEVLNH
jgi:hypothetical protein